ncbi:MAG: flavodoxin-dependent (E)-4-hydroxy-3-methylbut-2-enyl-diphosphate synthase, partial [bacterium]
MKRISRKIKLGSLTIGGGESPLLQTMISTPLEEYEKACEEARKSYEMGCGIVRTAVRNKEEIPLLEKFVSRFKGETIADIHFSASLALRAVEAGVSGVRINPGNIGGCEKVSEIVELLKKNENTALRIGVNSGSLEKDILKKHGGPTVSAMVESVRRWVGFLENELDFMNFKISAKSSDVVDTINIYEKIAAFTDAPLHAGITEAGYGTGGVI